MAYSKCCPIKYSIGVTKVTPPTRHCCSTPWSKCLKLQHLIARVWHLLLLRYLPWIKKKTFQYNILAVPIFGCFGPPMMRAISPRRHRLYSTIRKVMKIELKMLWRGGAKRQSISPPKTVARRSSKHAKPSTQKNAERTNDNFWVGEISQI